MYKYAMVVGATLAVEHIAWPMVKQAALWAYYKAKGEVSKVESKLK